MGDARLGDIVLSALSAESLTIPRDSTLDNLVSFLCCAPPYDTPGKVFVTSLPSSLDSVQYITHVVVEAEPGACWGRDCALWCCWAGALAEDVWHGSRVGSRWGGARPQSGPPLDCRPMLCARGGFSECSRDAAREVCGCYLYSYFPPQ